jgi:hypothetical protein
MEAWIRRSVVLEEAEDKLKEDFDIDALVEDYRASLLLHNYRQQLVATSLDTSISKDELSNFYEVSKDQYLLSEPIIRFKMAKFPSKTVGLERFFQNWKKDKESTISFIEQNAIFSMLNEEKWHTLSELQSYLPEGFRESKLSKPGDVQFYNDGEEYFVKIIEYIEEGDVPPLGYVKDKLSRVIINNKKKSLLADIERTLYQKYMASNKIKTYTK